MAVAATGSLHQDLNDFSAILSNSANFQTFVGEPGDAAAALLKIEPQRVETAGLSDQFAVVSLAEGYGFQNLSMQVGTGAIEVTPVLDFILERKTVQPAEAIDGDALRAIVNGTGPILDDLWALQGTAAYAHIQGITPVEFARTPKPGRTTRDSIWIILTVTMAKRYI